MLSLIGANIQNNFPIIRIFLKFYQKVHCENTKVVQIVYFTYYFYTTIRFLRVATILLRQILRPT